MSIPCHTVRRRNQLFSTKIEPNSLSSTRVTQQRTSEAICMTAALDMQTKYALRNSYFRHSFYFPHMHTLSLSLLDPPGNHNISPAFCSSTGTNAASFNFVNICTDGEIRTESQVHFRHAHQTNVGSLCDDTENLARSVRLSFRHA